MYVYHYLVSNYEAIYREKQKKDWIKNEKRRQLIGFQDVKKNQNNIRLI